MSDRSVHADRIMRISVVVAAIALWFPGLYTDFWLDEIWQLRLTQQVTSWVGIFTDIHRDTNHWLNSIYMYALGPDAYWALYRIPSFIAALGAMLLISVHGRGPTRRDTLMALLLTGASYFMTVYSSEARGYAPAMCCALLGMYAMQRYWETARAGWICVFVVSSCLGLLSHLTFLFVYLSFIVASVFHDVRRSGLSRDLLVRWVYLHLVPVMLLAVLYLVDIRYIQHGGGPERSWLEILLRAAAMFSIGPGTGVIGFAVLLVIGGIVLFEIVMLFRKKMDLALFYVSALAAFPCLLYLAGRMRGFSFWTERHLVVCMPFVLLLLLRFLARCYEKGPAGKAAFALIVSLYLIGNVTHVAAFIKDGRGHYFEALQYMARETKAPVITVRSDHDFRNAMVLSYYAAYLPQDKKLLYCSLGQRWPEEPEWFIAHSDERQYVPQPEIVTSRRIHYYLERHYPFGGISGWHWALYRRPSAGEPGSP